MAESLTMVVTEATFDDRTVRLVILDDEPWFVLADITEAAGAGRRWPQAVRVVDPDDRVEVPRLMLGAGAEHLRVNQRDALWLVSETGVYTLAASSMATPDAARRLRRWMIRELMPSVWAAAPPSVTRSDLPLRFRDVEVERRQPPPALTHTVSRGGPKHALYRLRSGVGGLLYVGISLNLAARLAQHRDCQPWWNEVVSVQVEPHPTREAALAAEREAIRTERPLHNIQHRVA